MEKTVVIVMDEELFDEQTEQIYQLRKTSIQTYNGNMIPVLEEHQESLKSKKDNKEEPMVRVLWQCKNKDCGYQWVGDKTDFDCPLCDENEIEEVDRDI